MAIPPDIPQISIDEIPSDASNKDEIISEFVSKHILPILPSKVKIITLDGFNGVGKSEISGHISRMLSVSHINIDDYLVREQGRFVGSVRVEALKEEVEQSLIKKGGVVIEGCMADDVLEKIGKESQFRIYVMETTRQHSETDSEGIEEYEVLYGDETCSYLLDRREKMLLGGSGEEPGRLDKELIMYHRNKRPHDRANLIIKRVR
ncbi:hypothetical protein [Magnetovibrio sp.]|uniref:hypothetical protein n=1 Tax=Magnetovibrio sp. TaxID=2024836 RepID=UPI002F932F45